MAQCEVVLLDFDDSRTDYAGMVPNIGYQAEPEAVIPEASRPRFDIDDDSDDPLEYIGFSDYDQNEWESELAVDEESEPNYDEEEEPEENEVEDDEPDREEEDMVAKAEKIRSDKELVTKYIMISRTEEEYNEKIRLVKEADKHGYNMSDCVLWA